MLNSTPTLNNLGSANWIAYVPGMEELALKLTKFSIPEVTAGVTEIENRTEFVLKTSGDHIQYEDLSVEFLIDENLLNYIKLYRWMRKNTHNGIDENQSVFVHFLGNDKRFQGIEIEFYEAFPISLDKIDLDTDGHDTDLTCTVTFAYTGFDFVDITDRDSTNPQ